MSQHKGGARVVGEFAVIVVGVLVALAADQWVEDRSDRAALRDYLGQVEAALLEDREHLVSRVDVVGVRSTAVAWLLSLDRSEIGAQVSCRQLEHGSSSYICDGSGRSLAADVVVGAYSVASPLWTRTVRGPYDDLRESGLARDLSGATRGALSEYYMDRVEGQTYWEAIETDLGLVVFGVVPPELVEQTGQFFTFTGTEDQAVETARALLSHEGVTPAFRRQSRRIRLQLSNLTTSLEVADQAIEAVRAAREAL